MPMLDAELISQQNRARLLMTFKSRPARPSVNAARLCKVLQLAEFKVPLTGCGGPYSQLFHSFCGKRRGANKLAEGEGLRSRDRPDPGAILQPKNELEPGPNVIDGANLYINQACGQTDSPYICF